MKFEISYEDLLTLRRQYLRCIAIQELFDEITYPSMSVMVRGYKKLVDQLSEEHDRRIKIGETDRRIKS